MDTWPKPTPGGLAALVTDADVRSPVAGLRALGRAGIRVHALSSARFPAGRWSRYSTTSTVGPHPGRDPLGFREAVGRLVSEYGPLVVYPGTEASLEALVADWPRLPGPSTIAYPGPEPLGRLRDKGALAQLGEEVGIATPRALAEGTAGDLAGMVAPGPCVVKASQPEGALGEVQLVDTPEDFARLLERLPATQPLMVQERRGGALMAISLVVGRDGELVARFQQRAARTWPHGAGASSLGFSEAPDEDLVARCARLLAVAGYWGLAQLQFVAGEDGPALIDVNPRFYGSLPLALACGVNLPAAWHAVAEGEAASQVRDYPAGVAYRWLEADFAAAAHGSLRELATRVPRPRAGAMWARDDPAPGLLLAMRSVGRALGRRRGP